MSPTKTSREPESFARAIWHEIVRAFEGAQNELGPFRDFEILLHPRKYAALMAEIVEDEFTAGTLFNAGCQILVFVPGGAPVRQTTDCRPEQVWVKVIDS